VGVWWLEVGVGGGSGGVKMFVQERKGARR